MSDVSFNEDSQGAWVIRAEITQKRSGMVGLVIRLGVAKDTAEANQILIGIVFLAVCIAGFLLFPILHQPNSDKILTPKNLDPITGTIRNT